MWGDEASLAVNFLCRDYLGLTRQLEHLQVAPILFLWLELSIRMLLGTSELALRLLPLLAGLGSLLLFWKLSRRTLPPMAAALAIGFLAVSYYPVRHSCEVKPYSVDLFCALALLLPALSWLQEPERLSRLGWLVLAAPIVIGISYPAVFIATAVSMTLLVPVWRCGNRKAWALFAGYNLLVLATFLACFLTVGRAQVEADPAVTDYYQEYWVEGFPPADWPGKLLWFVQAHSGEMLAYPVGGQNGASTLTLIWCVMGGWQLARQRRWELLALCLLPLALGLAASALHRYPYGASARLAQHLAPGICLLAGLGLAMGIRWVARSMPAQRRWLLATGVAMAFLGVGGMIHDVFKPYKTDTELWVRESVQDMVRRAGSDPIMTLHWASDFDSVFDWYLRAQGQRIHWGEIDRQILEGAGRRLWCLQVGPDDGIVSRLDEVIQQSPRSWALGHHTPHAHRSTRPGPLVQWQEVVWQAEEGDRAAACPQGGRLCER